MTKKAKTCAACGAPAGALSVSWPKYKVRWHNRCEDCYWAWWIFTHVVIEMFVRPSTSQVLVS